MISRNDQRENFSFESIDESQPLNDSFNFDFNTIQYENNSEPTNSEPRIHSISQMEDYFTNSSSSDSSPLFIRNRLRMPNFYESVSHHGSPNEPDQTRPTE